MAAKKRAAAPKKDKPEDQPDVPQTVADGVAPGERSEIVRAHGFQEGRAYPEQPSSPEGFQALAENPELPLEQQSAPSQEALNPHLFGPQGRF
jgi:hypothetical protein